MNATASTVGSTEQGKIDYSVLVSTIALVVSMLTWLLPTTDTLWDYCVSFVWCCTPYPHISASLELQKFYLYRNKNRKFPSIIGNQPFITQDINGNYIIFTRSLANLKDQRSVANYLPKMPLNRYDYWWWVDPSYHRFLAWLGYGKKPTERERDEISSIMIAVFDEKKIYRVLPKIVEDRQDPMIVVNKDEFRISLPLVCHKSLFDLLSVSKPTQKPLKLVFFCKNEVIVVRNDGIDDRNILTQTKPLFLKPGAFSFVSATLHDHFEYVVQMDGKPYLNPIYNKILNIFILSLPQSTLTKVLKDKTIELQDYLEFLKNYAAWNNCAISLNQTFDDLEEYASKRMMRRKSMTLERTPPKADRPAQPKTPTPPRAPTPDAEHIPLIHPDSATSYQAVDSGTDEEMGAGVSPLSDCIRDSPGIELTQHPKEHQCCPLSTREDVEDNSSATSNPLVVSASDANSMRRKRTTGEKEKFVQVWYFAPEKADSLIEVCIENYTVVRFESKEKETVKPMVRRECILNKFPIR